MLASNAPAVGAEWRSAVVSDSLVSTQKLQKGLEHKVRKYTACLMAMLVEEGGYTASHCSVEAAVSQDGRDLCQRKTMRL